MKQAFYLLVLWVLPTMYWIHNFHGQGMQLSFAVSEALGSTLLLNVLVYTGVALLYRAGILLKHLVVFSYTLGNRNV